MAKLLKIFNQSILDDCYGGVNFPGAVSIFSNCAQLMLESLPQRLQNLEESLLAENFEKVLFHAHQLKGSFGATGSDALVELCAQVELQAKEKNILGLQQSMHKFPALTMEFKRQLGRFLTQLQKN